MKYNDFSVAAPQQHGFAIGQVFEGRVLAAAAITATCAMRLFSAAHAFIRQRSSNRGGQLLCLACFSANDVAFRVAYAINQRRLSRMREGSAS